MDIKIVSNLALWFSVSASCLHAGIPVETEIECPIDGEKIQVVETTTCSTMGITMSLRQITSCDFITQLPVCPTTGVPLYTDFNENDIEAIKTEIETTTYQESLEQSAYFRAYTLDLKLEKFSAEERFWLLQSGYFYTPDTTYGNEAFYNAYQSTAEEALAQSDVEDPNIIRLMWAYNAVKIGEDQKARSLMEVTQTDDPDSHQAIEKYKALLEACIGKVDAQECQPEHQIELFD